LPLTNWIHVAGTYDGAELRIYTNGTLVAKSSYSLGIHPGLANVGIGRVPSNPSVTATTISNGFWNWGGLLDEVSLYDRALSETELKAIVAADQWGKCLAPPTFKFQPASQSIPAGEDVKFSAEVLGAKPITYFWTSNGVMLPVFAFNKPSLLIEKIRTSNGGIYSLLASNSLGITTRSDALLTVLPTNSCFEPPLGITDWWPGDNSGTNLIGFSRVTTISPNGASYIFTTGKVDRAFSSAPVRFTPPNPAGTWSVSAPTINFGPTNQFSIEAWMKAPSRPVFTINGKAFPSDADTEIILQKINTNNPNAGGYALFLDRGRLACSLKGSSNSGSNVVASFGPDLRDNMFHHVAVTVSRGSTNGGSLYVDGESVLTFDTTQLGGAISNSVSLLFLPEPVPVPFSLAPDTRVLALDELSFYSRALAPEEIHGIAAAGAAGKRKTRPVIKTQPNNQTAALGSDLTFTVVPDGSGFLGYTWLQSGVLVHGGTNRTLVLTNVAAAQSGSYSVRVSNVFGATVSSNAILNLLPVALCSNVIIAADPETCAANATIDAGSYDPEGKSITVSQLPPGPYPLGTTTVTLVVLDDLGASNSCAATVTVVDLTPPQMFCPLVPAIPNDLHQCGAVVRYALPTVTDTCSPITNLVCTPPPGSFFPVGTTTVNCTATDGAGNSAQCSFAITIVDSELPLISCPSDIVVTNAHDAWTSVVIFQVSASDNCPGVGSVMATPVSGSSFAIGTNSVSCVVTDAAGNTASCSFNVTVFPGNHPPTPVIDVSPLAHFPGWTNLIVIAPHGTSATVALDGSRSSDPDGDPFNYQWSEGTHIFSTNSIANTGLTVGTHEITLALDDHLPLGTNSASVTLEIITASDAVTIVVGLISDSDLSSKQIRPLIATLNAAAASFQRGSYTASINQLHAFQNKVAAQITPFDPELAAELNEAVRQIIEAVSPNAQSDAIF